MLLTITGDRALCNVAEHDTFLWKLLGSNSLRDIIPTGRCSFINLDSLSRSKKQVHDILYQSLTQCTHVYAYLFSQCTQHASHHQL